MAAKSTPIEHHRLGLERARAHGDEIKHLQEKLTEIQTKLANTRERVREARQRVDMLTEERAALTPAVLEGDEQARAEVDTIDVEVHRRRREMEMAKDVAEHYAEEMSEGEQLLQAAKEAAMRDKLESLSHKRWEAASKAEELMGGLLEQLEEIENLHRQQASLAASELGDQSMLLRPPDRVIAAWAMQRLRRYTGRPADGRLSAPLPEQDAYAKKGS